MFHLMFFFSLCLFEKLYEKKNSYLKQINFFAYLYNLTRLEISQKKVDYLSVNQIG